VYSGPSQPYCEDPAPTDIERVAGKAQLWIRHADDPYPAYRSGAAMTGYALGKIVGAPSLGK